MAEVVSRYIPMLEAFFIDFVSAIIILIMGWVISNIVCKAIRRLDNAKRRVDTTALPMISSFVQWTIRILTLVVVLSQFGVQTASLIAALGAAGVAIGLALQGTLQNIAAGIMLLSLRPLSQNEYVSIGSSYEGTVLEIGLFLTRLQQTNGITLTIPNSNVWNNTIINFSRNLNRRIDLPVALQYGEDTDKAIKLLTNLLESNEQVIKTQPYSVFVSEHRENCLILNLRAWVPTAVYFSELANLMLDVRKKLEDEGFDLPITRVEHVQVEKPALIEESEQEVAPITATTQETKQSS
ncbi:MAG: mechanosensitive ion channel [Alcaligenaceae bacterium]|nr:mechanosensitive ion channel [Alcaligenaceae bacterium]